MMHRMHWLMCIATAILLFSNENMAFGNEELYSSGAPDDDFAGNAHDLDDAADLSGNSILHDLGSSSEINKAKKKQKTARICPSFMKEKRVCECSARAVIPAGAKEIEKFNFTASSHSNVLSVPVIPTAGAAPEKTDKKGAKKTDKKGRMMVTVKNQECSQYSTASKTGGWCFRADESGRVRHSLTIDLTSPRSIVGISMAGNTLGVPNLPKGEPEYTVYPSAGFKGYCAPWKKGKKSIEWPFQDSQLY